MGLFYLNERLKQIVIDNLESTCKFLLLAYINIGKTNLWRGWMMKYILLELYYNYCYLFCRGVDWDKDKMHKNLKCVFTESRREISFHFIMWVGADETIKERKRNK